MEEKKQIPEAKTEAGFFSFSFFVYSFLYSCCRSPQYSMKRFKREAVDNRKKKKNCMQMGDMLLAVESTARNKAKNSTNVLFWIIFKYKKVLLSLFCGIHISFTLVDLVSGVCTVQLAAFACLFACFLGLTRGEYCCVFRRICV